MSSKKFLKEFHLSQIEMPLPAYSGNALLLGLLHLDFMWHHMLYSFLNSLVKPCLVATNLILLSLKHPQLVVSPDLKEPARMIFSLPHSHLHKYADLAILDLPSLIDSALSITHNLPNWFPIKFNVMTISPMEMAKTYTN
jgi:hypothetical protein